MVQLGNDSNLDGLVTGEELIIETWKSSNGDFLTIFFHSGNLFVVIQREKEKHGCSPEILSLTLQLQRDGNILGGWDLS